MRSIIFPIASITLFVGVVLACNDSSGGGGPSSSTSSSSSSSSSSGSSSGQASSSGGDSSTNPNDSQASKDKFQFSTQTITFEGKDRIIIVQKPKTYDAAKTYPLVLAFHGNPSTAQGMLDGTPFFVAGDEAIVGYPQAHDETNGLFDWNFGSPTPDNPDMKWVQTIPVELKKTINIDTRKVFGYGYSGGAFFITHFACRFGDVFAAIASHSGGGPDETQYPQKANGCYTCPGGAVATLVTHGQKDTGIEVANAHFTADCAVDTNVCNTTTAPSTPSSCVRYEGCPKDKPVELCINPNQGHELWGEAATKSWDFFRTFL